jgi:hypothetical protein
MSQARARLAAQAAAAGYPPPLLTTVAEAALPRYTAGKRLDEAQIEQLTIAVETLAQAGVTAEELPVLVAHYRRRYDRRWQERFWAHTLRSANVRYAHPELYGLSPCETDAARLAQHRTPPTAPARPTASGRPS